MASPRPFEHLLYQALVTLNLTGLAFSQVPIQTLALRGDPAPGIGNGVTISGFEGTASINSEGRATIHGALAGPGVSSENGSAVWEGFPGSLNLVVRAGDHAPGTATDVNFKSFEFSHRGGPNITSTGELGFKARLTGSGVESSNEQGFWTGAPGNLQLLARNGTPAPRTESGVNFSNLAGTPSFDQSGQAMFSASVDGPGVDSFNNDGLWIGTPGSLDLLAREGDQAPDTDPGVTFSLLRYPALSASGIVALSANIEGPGITSDNNSGIWMGMPNDLKLVLRSGDPAPDMEPGVTFRGSGFGLLEANDSGQIAFSGVAVGPSSPFQESWGIWVGAPDSLSLAAKVGDQPPGVEPGVEYDLFRSTLLTSSGKVVFEAELSEPGTSTVNKEAIFAGYADSLELVMREGDQAPGAEFGVNFGPTVGLVANGPGQLAFQAFLTGMDVDGSNDRGIWATDPEGDLRLVAREGDVLEVAPGDFRTILSLSSNLTPGGGGSSGKVSGFNDLGQLTFRAGLSGGSDAILIATIPEPNSILLLLVGGALFRNCRELKRGLNQL